MKLKLRKKYKSFLLRKKFTLNKRIKKFRKIFILNRLRFKFRRYNLEKLIEIRKRNYFKIFSLLVIRRLLLVNFFFKKNRNIIKNQLCVRFCNIFSVLRVCMAVLKKSLFFLKQRKLFFRKFRTICKGVIRRFNKILVKYRRYTKLYFLLNFKNKWVFIDFLDVEPQSLSIYELDYLGLKPREWYIDTQLPSFFEFFIEKRGLIGPKISMDYKKFVTLKRISYAFEENDESWGEKLLSFQDEVVFKKFKIEGMNKFFKFFRRIRLFSRKFFRETFRKRLNWRYEKYKKIKQNRNRYKGRSKTAILHFKSYHSNYYMTLTDLSYNVVYTCSAGMFAETNSKKQKISTIVCTPMLLKIWEVLKGHRIKSLKFELTDRFDKFFYNAFSFFRRRRYFIKTISMVSKSPHNFGQRLNKPRRI